MIDRIPYRTTVARWALVLAAGCALPVHGQEAPTAGPVSESPAADQEILVTARRRAEKLQDVPLSIVSLSAAALRDQSVTTEADLQRVVPGLVIRQATTQNELIFALRGQSIDSYSASPPAVLTYVNDVQFTRTSASSLFDLDSVQVLKGPQGTLFGRNVTGGAVLYGTATPKNDLAGSASVSIGNFDLRRGEAMLNLPIVDDKVLLRVAAYGQKRDGYVHNIADDSHIGADNRWSGRATLLLKPAEGIRNTTMFQYERSKGDNVGLKLFSVNDCGSTNNGIPLSSSAACLYSPLLDTILGAPGAWQAYLAAHPDAYPGGLSAFLAAQRGLGFWTVDQNIDAGRPIHRGKTWLVTNTTEIDIAADTTIKNIFGASRVSTFDKFDQIGAPYGIEPPGTPFGDGYSNRIKQISEELQLQGKAANSRLDYIFGAYYADQKTNVDNYVTFFDVSPIIPPTLARSHYRAANKTAAVFAQASLDLEGMTGISGLTFTAGARYTREKVQLNLLPGDRYGALVEERASWSRPSWQVGLDYKVSPAVLLYVVQRGSWRAGGFNGTSPPVPVVGAQGGNKFVPEKTHDIEAGLKAQGRLGNLPYAFNLAVYNQWIRDVQRTAFITPPGGVLASYTANIPAAEVTGFEVQGNVQLASWLEIGGNLAYTDARYTNPVADLLGTVVRYGPYADSAKWSGSVFSQVTLPIPADLGKMTVRGDVYAQAKQYFSNFNDTIAPGTALPGYKLVNLRLQWREIAGTGFGVSAFATNLFNEKYYAGGLSQGISVGTNGVSLGVPRMYGIEASFAF